MNSQTFAQSQRITILGDGAWGTALAQLYADNGHQVTIWCHNNDIAHSIQTQHVNQRYAQDIKLNPSIIATTDIEQALSSAMVIVQAVPVMFLRLALQSAGSCFTSDQRWVIASKGIEQKTGQLSTHIITDVIQFPVSMVVLSGPSFAHDVLHKQLTAAVLASRDTDTIEIVRNLMHNNYFIVYASNDPIGVQVSGALKNVIALGIGLLHGAGHTDNTKAYFLYKGLREIELIISAFGGDTATVYGLAGIGDVVLTAFGKHSKNVAVGTLLGQGKTIHEVQRTIPVLPEGINTLHVLPLIIQKHGLKLPLCTALYNVVAHGKSPTIVVDALGSGK